MHILTGMIVSALLRRRAKSHRSTTKSLPRFRTGPIKVCHELPGRIRFRVDSLVGDFEGAVRLEKTLSRLDGLSGAAVNPVTGSVLVRFDRHRLEPDLLLGAIARLLGLEDQMNRTPTPAVQRELRAAGSSLNRAVLEQTRGVIDLNTLVMIGLGVIGARKLLSERGGALPAGVTLLWWAAHSLGGRSRDAAT